MLARDGEAKPESSRRALIAGDSGRQRSQKSGQPGCHQAVEQFNSCNGKLVPQGVAEAGQLRPHLFEAARELGQVAIELLKPSQQKGARDVERLERRRAMRAKAWQQAAQELRRRAEPILAKRDECLPQRRLRDATRFRPGQFEGRDEEIELDQPLEGELHHIAGRTKVEEIASLFGEQGALEAFQLRQGRPQALAQNLGQQLGRACALAVQARLQALKLYHGYTQAAGRSTGRASPCPRG